MARWSRRSCSSICGRCDSSSTSSFDGETLFVPTLNSLRFLLWLCSANSGSSPSDLRPCAPGTSPAMTSCDTEFRMIPCKIQGKYRRPRVERADGEALQPKYNRSARENAALGALGPAGGFVRDLTPGPAVGFVRAIGGLSSEPA